MDENRSKDFRYVFANAFGARLSDNDATLTFGITEGGSAEDMLQEVAIIMTPRTLKIIANNITVMIQGYEEESGEISVPPGKLVSSFDELIKAHVATVKIKKPAAKKRVVKKPAAKKPTKKKPAK